VAVVLAHGGPLASGALRRALACVLVAGLVLATHAPVLGTRALAPDDNDYITYNPLITRPAWASAGRFFGEVLEPSTVQGYYHPLAMTSLMIDYALGGRAGDLRAFHRTSLALHIVNTVLVLLILDALFGAVVPAAAAALVFGLHPLAVEPMAWVAERKAILAAAFSFACLMLYVGYCRGRGRIWLAGAAGCFTLALLSKPTATPLPVLMLILDAWPLQRFGRRAIAEKWPFFLLALAGAAVTVASQRGFIVAPEHGDVARWPLHIGYVLALYLRHIVWPVQLSCIYPRPDPLALSNPAVLASVISVAALGAMVVLLAKRTPAPLAGGAFFLAALAPTLTLGVVKYSWAIAFDHYLYLPAIGLIAVLAAALGYAWEHPKRIGGGARPVMALAVLLILAAEAWGSRLALANWKDSLTLYRHMERIAPGSPVIHNNLGSLLAAEADPAGAMRELDRALELEPAYGDAHYNLGIVLAGQGRIDESVEHFRKAADLLPRSADAAYNLGLALDLANQPEQAELELRRALRLKPDHLDAMDRLGGMLAVQGRVEEAVEQFRMALSYAPDAPLLNYRMGMALMLKGGEPREAARHLELAVRGMADWPEALNALAWLEATSPDPGVRDTSESLRHARRAVELTGGGRPDMLDTRAAAEAAAGRFDEAVATAARAQELARRSGADSLARSIGDRIRLYRRHGTYTEPAGSVTRVP
jgi:protein O-mannosyl-transferase